MVKIESCKENDLHFGSLCVVCFLGDLLHCSRVVLSAFSLSLRWSPGIDLLPSYGSTNSDPNFLPVKKGLYLCTRPKNWSNKTLFVSFRFGPHLVDILRTLPSELEHFYFIGTDFTSSVERQRSRHEICSLRPGPPCLLRASQAFWALDGCSPMPTTNISDIHLKLQRCHPRPRGRLNFSKTKGYVHWGSIPE